MLSARPTRLQGRSEVRHSCVTVDPDRGRLSTPQQRFTANREPIDLQADQAELTPQRLDSNPGSGTSEKSPAEEGFSSLRRVASKAPSGGWLHLSYVGGRAVRISVGAPGQDRRVWRRSPRSAHQLARRERLKYLDQARHRLRGGDRLARHLVRSVDRPGDGVRAVLVLALHALMIVSDG